jgi:hypothetical protein
VNQRTFHALTARLQHLARDRADNEARRIPWQRLLEARGRYIDWQEFYLWARSILEVEPRIPEWLREVLNNRCPGFLDKEERGTERPASKGPLHLCLEEWIENEIFGSIKRDGWFNAIAYYANREPRYQRAEVCWSECVKKWKRVKPIRYPSFEEWKSITARWDSTVHPLAWERKSRAFSPRVGS